MRISEAQGSVAEILKTHKIKRSPLASIVGVYEELGELSSAILQKEGFKERERRADVGCALAEVLFELLKLAEDLEVDLEKEFMQALERWRVSKPLWK